MQKLILFDFDGTLADTAPDLAATANLMRSQRGLEPLPYETLRPMASQGARGLLKASLGLEPEQPEYEEHRLRFLSEYEKQMTSLTQLFPGIDELLETLK
ncbi:MAG TPA: phosphoglycolate phosphatase, partial [Pusillimonas sp.]|nr:phosphoglycolate phosphatase [Pusillimonas sp.]